MVDVAGRRHQLTALEGQTLVQVLQEHDELLGSDGAYMAVLPLQNCCGMCAMTRLLCYPGRSLFPGLQACSALQCFVTYVSVVAHVWGCSATA